MTHERAIRLLEALLMWEFKSNENRPFLTALHVAFPDFPNDGQVETYDIGLKHREGKGRERHCDARKRAGRFLIEWGRALEDVPE